MRRKKKKLDCDFEKLEEDKEKRDFIKKSLLGVGALGVAGVLGSSLASATKWVKADNLDLTNPLPITEGGTGNTTGTGVDSDKLDGQDGTYYRCSSGCSWTCSNTCTGSCVSGCTGGCTGCTSCTSTCSGTCNTSCVTGCSSSCTGTCESMICP